MARRIVEPGPAVLLAGLVACLTAAAGSTPAWAQARGDSPASRERQAVDICADELRRREQARDVSVQRILRSDYRDGRVRLDGVMRVRRDGPDRTRRVDCVVDFEGKNRVVRFSVDGGGDGDFGDAPRRACRDEAERAGLDMRGVADVREVAGWGRLVMLRVERGGEAVCLWRGSPRGRGAVQGVYVRRR
jgi:hypothetical protein